MASESVERLARKVRKAIVPTAMGREQALHALGQLTAQIEELEQERDDYRFWNERVRICEHHTDDVTASVGDCLICNIDVAEQRVEELERERDHAKIEVGRESELRNDAEQRVKELEAAIRDFLLQWERHSSEQDDFVVDAVFGLRAALFPEDSA